MPSTNTAADACPDFSLVDRDLPPISPVSGQRPESRCTPRPRPDSQDVQPPKDKYELMEDKLGRVQHELKQVYADLGICKLELKKTRQELGSAHSYIGELIQIRQKYDRISGLQTELTDVNWQTEDAKYPSEVRDTLSVSELGQKVPAPNEYSSPARLGEAFIHQPRDSELQEDLDTAAAKSQEMSGERAAEGTGPGGGVASQAHAGRPPNAQVLLGHLPEDDQQEIYSHIEKDPPKLRATIPVHLEIRSTTARPPRRDSQDVKPHNSKRESKKLQPDCELQDTLAAAITFAATTSTTTKLPPSIDDHDARSRRSSQLSSEWNSSDWNPLTNYVTSDQGERPIVPKRLTRTGSKMPRVILNCISQLASYTPVARSSKDTQDSPPDAAETTGPRAGSHSFQPPLGGRPNAQALSSHFPEYEQEEISEIRQSAQVSDHRHGRMGSILSSLIPEAGPPPSKDKYQGLKEDFHEAQNFIKGLKLELQKARGESRDATKSITELHKEKKQLQDRIVSLQSELVDVKQKLEGAKTLLELHGMNPLDTQVFSTDKLSISEVGKKVTVLNEEIFQAAAALGEVLIHHHHDLSPGDLDVAAAESRELVGEKISNILISQAWKTPEINPFVAQVVLQIFIVKSCVSKIRSWYPSDTNIGGFLDQLYTDIRLKEDQAVSGRWRALTRAHTRPATETWTNELRQKLMSLLKIASWDTSSLKGKDSFVRRLTHIFKAVIELRDAIGEQFTSADLDISTFDCDIAYNPSYMEDEYGGGRQQTEGNGAVEIIVGTTGIGLKKFKAKRGAKDALQFQSIISAKIVLESTLKETLEPLQSSRRPRQKKPVQKTSGTYEDGYSD